MEFYSVIKLKEKEEYPRTNNLARFSLSEHAESLANIPDAITSTLVMILVNNSQHSRMEITRRLACKFQYLTCSSSGSLKCNVWNRFPIVCILNRWSLCYY